MVQNQTEAVMVVNLFPDHVADRDPARNSHSIHSGSMKRSENPTMMLIDQQISHYQKRLRSLS
jgi:hypothetical protein